MKKIILISFFLVSVIFFHATQAIAREANEFLLPSLGIVLEEVQLNCSEFKPNLITKFLWKEGPTRGLLYNKCLDQIQDDKNFEKYSEAFINDSNILDLSKDIKAAKTRLTILTLTTALKNYLADPETNDNKMEQIKKSVVAFKQHYKDKKAMLDKEIKEMKRKESKQGLELITLIEENEADLGKSIDSTIEYIDFVLQDRHAYTETHNKFFPAIYENHEIFRKAKLSKYECNFLKLHFGDKWNFVRRDLMLTCLKK